MWPSAALALQCALRPAINGRPQCCQLFQYTYHCINVHIIELDLGLNFHGKMKLSEVLRIKFKFNPLFKIMNQKNKCIIII